MAGGRGTRYFGPSGSSVGYFGHFDLYSICFHTVNSPCKAHFFPSRASCCLVRVFSITSPSFLLSTLSSTLLYLLYSTLLAPLDNSFQSTSKTNSHHPHPILRSRWTDLRRPNVVNLPSPRRRPGASSCQRVRGFPRPPIAPVPTLNGFSPILGGIPFYYFVPVLWLGHRIHHTSPLSSTLLSSLLSPSSFPTAPSFLTSLMRETSLLAHCHTTPFRMMPIRPN